MKVHIDFQVSKLFYLGCISDMSKNFELFPVKASATI